MHIKVLLGKNQAVYDDVLEIKRLSLLMSGHKCESHLALSNLFVEYFVLPSKIDDENPADVLLLERHKSIIAVEVFCLMFNTRYSIWYETFA